VNEQEAQAAFRRAIDELPDAGRDVILRSPNGGMRAAARLPLEMMRQIYEDRSSHPNAALFDGDAPPHWWVNESGYLASVKDDDEWIYEELYVESPAEVLEATARALLSAAATIKELGMGVLERRSGLDRAARLSLIRSTDFMAHVAGLVLGGHVSEGAAARFKQHAPGFDLDLEELVGLQDVRNQMSALIASGAVSPFVNMDEPVARDEAAELRAATKALLDPETHDPAYDPTFGPGVPSMHAVDRARAALAASEGQP